MKFDRAYDNNMLRCLLMVCIEGTQTHSLTFSLDSRQTHTNTHSLSLSLLLTKTSWPVSVCPVRIRDYWRQSSPHLHTLWTVPIRIYDVESTSSISVSVCLSVCL